MRRAYLFDLDGTLVDTSRLADARQGRRWKECIGRLGETSVFPGIINMLAAIRQGEAKVAVVTTAVSFYAESVLRHHQIPYDTLVAYHDVTKTKPAPDCYLLALSRFGLLNTDAVGVGDDRVDALSLSAAQIQSVGAGWNSAYHSYATWGTVGTTPNDVLNV